MHRALDYSYNHQPSGLLAATVCCIIYQQIVNDKTYTEESFHGLLTKFVKFPYAKAYPITKADFVLF